MMYFFVEAYHNVYGDYEFQVFTESKEYVERLIREHVYDEGIKIHKIYGPFLINPGFVNCIKEPS